MVEYLIRFVRIPSAEVQELVYKLPLFDNSNGRLKCLLVYPRGKPAHVCGVRLCVCKWVAPLQRTQQLARVHYYKYIVSGALYVECYS